MAGADDVETRGAIEAGERGGGAAASRFSRESGRGRGAGAWYGTMQLFSQGEGGGRGGRSTLLNPAERVFAEFGGG